MSQQDQTGSIHTFRRQMPHDLQQPHDLRQWTEKACELQTMALFVSFCFVNQQCSQTWNNNCHRRWSDRKEQQNSDAESGSSCSANVSWSFKIKHHVMAIRKQNTATRNACELQFETLLLFSFAWKLQWSRGSYHPTPKWPSDDSRYLAHMINDQVIHVIHVILLIHVMTSCLASSCCSLALAFPLHLARKEQPAQDQECAHQAHDRQVPACWWTQSRCSNQFTPKHC